MVMAPLEMMTQRTWQSYNVLLLALTMLFRFRFKDVDTAYESREPSNVTVGWGSAASDRGSIRFRLVSPKAGRSQNDFIRAGIQRSIGTAMTSEDA